MSDLTLKDRFLEAIKEDCPKGDVTAQLFSDERCVRASIVARERGRFSGCAWGDAVLNACQGDLKGDVFLREGELFDAGTIVMSVEGAWDVIVKIERVLLNLLQHVCGVATLTAAYVDALGDPSIAVMDTRKTMPLWRDLEKKAVVAGGGVNHRHHLSDMILIKENHLSAYLLNHSLESFGHLMKQSKMMHPDRMIELELETLDQCRTFPLDFVDIILLDNFSMKDLDEAVEVLRNRNFLSLIEVSGNVSLETISQYRGKPIDRISVGRLTHSVKAIDFSLLVERDRA